MRTHSESVRVEFVDTDAGGRIHHTAALRWAERAEHQLLRAIGWPELTCFPRRHVVAEFLAPLRFGDEVRVEIQPTAVGQTSITYGWTVLRGVELCAAFPVTEMRSCAHEARPPASTWTRTTVPYPSPTRCGPP